MKKSDKMIKFFGFLIMLIFSGLAVLIGLSIGNMADLLLVFGCISFALFGLMLWRKRTFGIFTKTSVMIIGLASLLLVTAVLPAEDSLDKNVTQVNQESKVKESAGSKDNNEGPPIKEETNIIEETSQKNENATRETTEESGILETDAVEHQVSEGILFVGNINSKVYHEPNCEGVAHIKPQNRKDLSSLEEVRELGLTPADDCHPDEKH